MAGMKEGPGMSLEHESRAPSLLSLPISTTPLFICFLIGAKPVKCCRTELEVICSYLCLPELGDEVECS